MRPYQLRSSPIVDAYGEHVVGRQDGVLKRLIVFKILNDDLLCPYLVSTDSSPVTLMERSVIEMLRRGFGNLLRVPTRCEHPLCKPPCNHSLAVVERILRLLQERRADCGKNWLPDESGCMIARISCLA